MENELVVMLFESKRFELVDRQRDRSIYLPTDTTILNFPGSCWSRLPGRWPRLPRRSVPLISIYNFHISIWQGVMLDRDQALKSYKKFGMNFNHITWVCTVECNSLLIFLSSFIRLSNKYSGMQSFVIY
jgi:hypothetical protein